MEPGTVIMIACVLGMTIWAIRKGFEPLLLIRFGFRRYLANTAVAGMADPGGSSSTSSIRLVCLPRCSRC